MPEVAKQHTIKNQWVTGNGNPFFIGKLAYLARFNGFSRPDYVNLETMFYKFS